MYVKIFPEASSKALINEVASYILAKNLGLPTPDKSALIKLRRSKLPFISKTFNSAPEYLTAFAVSEIPGGTLGNCWLKSVDRLPRVIEKALNKGNLIHKIAAFDNWIGNSDRHLNNIIRDRNGKFHIIDHTHSFTSPNWSIKSLNRNAKTRNLILDIIWKYGLPTNDLVSIIEECKNHHPSIGDSLNEVLFWAEVCLQKEESDTMIDFIKYRSKEQKKLLATTYGQLDI